MIPIKDKYRVEMFTSLYDFPVVHVILVVTPPIYTLHVGSPSI